MNKLIETAPPEIYLCIADDADEDYEAFPYDATDEITWAESPVTDITVRYIRADLTERPTPCKTHCEARACQIEIRQMRQALLDASIALIDAANAIEYYGPNPHQKGWQEDSQEAQDAAAKATSVAMSGSEPATS